MTTITTIDAEADELATLDEESERRVADRMAVEFHRFLAALGKIPAGDRGRR